MKINSMARDQAQQFVTTMGKIHLIVFTIFQSKHPYYTNEVRSEETEAAAQYQKDYFRFRLVRNHLAFPFGLVFLSFTAWVWSQQSRPDWTVTVLTILGSCLLASLVTMLVMPPASPWKISRDGDLLMTSWHEGLVRCGISKEVIQTIVDDKSFGSEGRKIAFRTKCAEALCIIKKRSEKEFLSAYHALHNGGMVDHSREWFYR